MVKKILRRMRLGLVILILLSLVTGLTLLNPHFYLTKMSVLMKTGKLAMAEGDYYTATEQFLLAINLNPGKTQAYLLLADAYIAMSGGEKTYTVMEGDTLETIAAAFYPEPEDMDEAIYVRNMELIADKNALTPGLVITLPYGGGLSAPDYSEEAIFYLKKALERKENALLRNKYNEILGETATPEPSVEPSVEPSPSIGPEERYYTIRGGDSLSSISIGAYGSNELADAIYERNKDRITSPYQLERGMVIVLPEDTRVVDVTDPAVPEAPITAETEPPEPTDDPNAPATEPPAATDDPNATPSPSGDPNASPSPSGDPNASPSPSGDTTDSPSPTTEVSPTVSA